MQAKIEKERIHAKTVINSLRSELDRVQQYARNQGGRRNLPATDSTAGASDESVAKAGHYSENARLNMLEWQK